MRGGQAHDLMQSAEHTQDERPAKYRCNACGEGYQVRTSAPSCRISLLEQMQQLEAPRKPGACCWRIMEGLVRRRFDDRNPSRGRPERLIVGRSEGKPRRVGNQ
jgi:hypothetical protein